MIEEIEKKPVFFYGEGSSEAHYIKDVLMDSRYPLHRESKTWVLADPSPHNGGENTPVQLLDKAITSCINPLAECWCIFDGDGDQHNWEKFKEKYAALEKDVKERIHLVFQNSCWELWLVLHIRDVAEPLTEPQLITILQTAKDTNNKPFFKNYRKGRTFKFEILKTKQALNLASDRSKALQGGLSAIDHIKKYAQIKQYTKPVTTMNELVQWFKDEFPHHSYNLEKTPSHNDPI